MNEIPTTTTTTTMPAPPRMLTVREVAATGVLRENAIRAGMREGWVPYIKSGNKALINYDKLIAKLESL